MDFTRHRRRQLLLVPREVDGLQAEFRQTLSLRNACVAFYDDQYSFDRSHVVVKGNLLSPIVVHGFSERSQGYVRLTTVRAAESHEWRALDKCWNAPLGMGVPLAHPTSIYHQLFHAVSSWLSLRGHLIAAGMADDAPASAFVPLVFASAALGHGKPISPRRWYGWELTLRPLTRASASDIAAATSRLLRTPCTCFDRFEAETRPLNPGARSSAELVRRFRDASLRNAPQPPLPNPSDASVGELLLVSRQGGRRAMTNEAELWGRLSTIGGVVPRRVILETIPLAEQMHTMRRAAVLVAVHGQALAWVTFLPSERRTTAVVEITISTRRGGINGCYQIWSEALGVRYFRTAGHLTGGCTGGASSRDNEAMRAHKMLSCNVTVDVNQVYAAAHHAASIAAGR